METFKSASSSEANLGRDCKTQYILSSYFFQEIANLAAKILRSTLAGRYIASDKRNAGTIDSLYNLPHLFDAGKR